MSQVVDLEGKAIKPEDFQPFDADNFESKLMDFILENSGPSMLGEVLGALELVKHHLLKVAFDDSD